MGSTGKRERLKALGVKQSDVNMSLADQQPPEIKRDPWMTDGDMRELRKVLTRYNWLQGIIQRDRVPRRGRDVGRHNGKSKRGQGD